MNGWLTWLALASLAVAIVCAAAIVVDIVIGGHRQRMWIMAVVWPVTALYLGPVAVWAYRRWGRAGTERHTDHEESSSVGVRAVALATSHCGAGCTLGDIVGASAVFVLGLQLAGQALWAELVVDFLLAYILGIVFQYLTIAPMRGLGLADGVKAALRADTLSLVAFEIGLFGWMIVLQLVILADRPLHPDEPAYWLSMQLGMILGFLTAYPANWWLVRHGYKERM